MKRIHIVVLVLAFAATGACADRLTVPDYNNPSLEELTKNPTPTTIAGAATGLLVGTRVEAADRNGYVSLLGILGRESYNFDNADPRFVTEMLEGGLDQGSPAFGGNLWNDRYRNIRNATILLDAVGTVEGLSDAEKEAVRGFAKTIQALDFLKVINTRDVEGAVIDVGGEPTDDPGPIVGKDQVFAHIVSLLDAAQQHLESAGSTAFPFPLSDGFDGFDSPNSFIEFNRALKARVDVYRGEYAAALASLSASFLTLDADALDRGVYHSFGTGSGDARNALFDPGESPDILAHPSFVDDAEDRADGTPDLRVQENIRTVPSRTQRGISTDVAFDIYESPDAPLPMIRNEELILLRAEARLFENDHAGAAEDINFIRVQSGGLDRIPNLDRQGHDAILNELLEQRRYSLMFEGGHRWIDLRRHGRLDDPDLLDLPDHQMNSLFPIPEAECLAQPGGCP